MEDPEVKTKSDEYNKIQAELDTIKGERDSVFKNLTATRKERADQLQKKEGNR
jgi:hypothetical protein